jgi:carbazole 1,9a-dioxygenase terminal dioxygenase component
VRLIGENVILRRVDGRVRALQDRCLHQGVRFSRKPECYTPDAITCWYHGFTYRRADGKLVEILTEPDSKLRHRSIPSRRTGSSAHSQTSPDVPG